MTAQQVASGSTVPFLIPSGQIKKLRNDPAKTAAAAGLHYIQSANAPGYFRKGRHPRFYYVDDNGQRCADKAQIRRIKSLVLPPAWQSVWISQDPEAHLQATGIDADGRKQYRYHPHWNLIRNQAKYYRLLAFSEVLPALREQVEHDLRRHEPTLEKVTALVIRLMDKTCIRVGNERYRVKHGSAGMTTLDARHATVRGSTIRFLFKGKKGIKQDIVLRDARLARLVKQFKDMPGKRLFKYVNENGGKCALNASQVNAYIRKHTGGNYSAKDFRTWMGTLTAFEFLGTQQKFENQRQFTRIINSCYDTVAGHLGNTRAVCKKYYIHPAVIRAYEHHKIQRFLHKEVGPSAQLTPSEQLLKLLLARPA
ncbi:hypothetical protein DYBT9275_06111 [Dyadobacter sp. CECT 9275]|uniref:DNA topoisomerase n=1 Tax=Dyadobacter helix TaxID=2822344 RepID=A0A916N8X3_9BACT|nr:DNA topoisomerase IB [Dyadobacter sp. CECT 9275]CAG5018962.1 hypothetical protein DYBT9275_06111 [Dyadobacter sp. CECT 9275]